MSQIHKFDIFLAQTTSKLRFKLTSLKIINGMTLVASGIHISGGSKEIPGVTYLLKILAQKRGLIRESAWRC